MSKVGHGVNMGAKICPKVSDLVDNSIVEREWIGFIIRVNACYNSQTDGF